MEAVWTRCLPAYREMKSLIEEGAIGKIKFIEANFSFKSPWGKDRRLFNKELAGGGIYDVGVYNFALVSDLLGNTPEVIHAAAIMSETGVDEQCSAILQYPDALANTYCGFQLETNHQAIIYGTEGKVIMERHWKLESFTIVKGLTTERIHQPFDSTGYVHEIEEAIDCISKGLLESPQMRHEDSLALTKIMDNALLQIGYK